MLQCLDHAQWIMPADDFQMFQFPCCRCREGAGAGAGLRTLIVDIIALILDMPTTDFICQSTISSLLVDISTINYLFKAYCTDARKLENLCVNAFQSMKVDSIFKTIYLEKAQGMKPETHGKET